MDTDVAGEARLQVALVCGPEILRLGLERVLAHDSALSVRAYRRLEAVQGTPEVAILCDRDLGDAAGACAAAAERLGAGVVLVTAWTDPHVVLDCLAAGITDQEIHEQYPSLPTDATRAALAYSATH